MVSESLELGVQDPKHLTLCPKAPQNEIEYEFGGDDAAAEPTLSA